MPFQKIREAVLSEATAEAVRIVESARIKITDTLQGQKDRIVRESERRYTASAFAIEDDCQRKLVQHKGASGKQILEKRNALLRVVFQRAEESLLAWPEDRYEAFMTHLIVHAAEVGGGRLRIHRDEGALFARMLSRINKDREARGQITLDDRAFLAERGGFIFLGHNYEVDRRLDTMLNQIEQELIPVIAMALFGGTQ